MARVATGRCQPRLAWSLSLSLFALACGEAGRTPPGLGGGSAVGGEGGAPEWTGDYRWTECGRIAATPSEQSTIGVTFTPDGELLASEVVFAADAGVSAALGGSCTIELRSWPEGELLSEIAAGPDCAHFARLALAPSGSRVGLVGEEGVRVFDVASASLLFEANVPLAPNLPPVSVAILDDRTLVLTATPTSWLTDGPELLTYADDGSVLERVRLAALSPPVAGGGWPVLSPDGTAVAAAVWDDAGTRAAVWSGTTGEALWQRPIAWHLGGPVFSLGGDFVYVGDSTFEVASPDVVWTTRWRGLPQLEPSRVPRLALAPDGQRLGGFMESGHRLSVISAAGGLPHYLGPPSVPAALSNRELRSLALSADGQALVVVGEETLLWTLTEPFEESRPSLLRSGPYLARVEVDPTGRWAAFGGDGRHLTNLVDGSSVTFTPTSVLEPCVWMQLRFSPDARFLLSLSWDSMTEVFAMDELEAWANRSESAVPSTRSAGVGCQSFAFSHDGTRIETENGWLDATELPELPRSVAGSSVEHHARDSYVTSAKHGDAVSSQCDGPECRTVLRSARFGDRPLTSLTAPFPSFSPDGDWLVAGPVLEHLPSKSTATLGAATLVSLFTPGGQIMVSERDGSLVRYCRER